MKGKHIKLTITMLTCTCLMALSGCGKKDPFTVYDEASQKTAKLNSAEMTADVTMSITIAEDTMDMTTSSSIIMSGMNTDNMEAVISSSMGIPGQSVEMQNYYKDGYYYMESGGIKQKYRMDLEEFQKQLASSHIQTDLKKEDFKEISLEKKDGSQIVTFTIDGTKMTGLVDGAMASLEGLMAGADADMNIGDVSGTASINKDGYFTDVDMTIPLTMTVNQMEMSMDMDTATTYINPGKEVTPEFPDDLDSYTEIDMSFADEANNACSADSIEEATVDAEADFE